MAVRIVLAGVILRRFAFVSYKMLKKVLDALQNITKVLETLEQVLETLVQVLETLETCTRK